MFEHGFPPYWSTIKKLIWLVGTGIVGGVTEIWKTVTGTLIHITDALEAPMRKCEVSLEPIQDLHGQDAPYPAGGGANKFDISNVLYWYAPYGLTVTHSGDTITVSGTPTSTGTGAFAILQYGDTSLSGLDYVVQAFDVTGGTINNIYGFRTTTERDLAIAINRVAGTAINLSFKVSVSQTSQTAWSPFANICPITGWTGCEVTRTGVNMFDETQYQNLTTTYEYSSDYYHCKSIQLTPNTKYTVSQRAGTEDSSIIALMNNVPKVNDIGYFNLRTESGSKTYTTDSTGKLYIGVLGSDDSSFNARLALCKIQIELGSTATDYEPYSGTTLSVTFPDGQTVYGGTVDLVSGVLRVTYGVYSITGNESFSSTGVGQHIISSPQIRTLGGKVPSDNKDVANVYTPFAKAKSYETLNVSGETDGIAFGQNNYILVGSIQYDAWSDFVGMPIVFELATPLTYQLTPQQIATLKGENNVWSNSNGDITIIYKAQAE